MIPKGRFSHAKKYVKRVKNILGRNKKKEPKKNNSTMEQLGEFQELKGGRFDWSRERVSGPPGRVMQDIAGQERNLGSS